MNQRNHKRGQPMNLWSEALFAEQKNSEKRRFEKEGKDSFHRERRCDHTARVLRKAGPIGAELKFHRYTRNDAKKKIYSEYLGPETGCFIVAFISRAEGQRLENHDQRREAHCQLRKNIVIRDRKSEVQTMKRKRAVHRSCSAQLIPRELGDERVRYSERSSVHSAIIGHYLNNHRTSRRSILGMQLFLAREFPSFRCCRMLSIRNNWLLVLQTLRNALTSEKAAKGGNMKKADAILSVRLLAAPLLIPSVRAYADDDSPGNHRQREALRQDQRKLEQLRDPVRFASAAKFRRNVAQARRSEIPDPVLTLRIRPGWKDQSAATSENPPIILISAFEIADDRVRG